MADDTFDAGQAASRQRAIVEEASRIRDGLEKDVINYYYNRAPQSAAEEGKNRSDLRRYLNVAYERLNDLLTRMR